MASWKEIGAENIEGAKMLLADAKYRSAVSRAYYAAFSSVNDVFDRGGFMNGLRTPSHRSIPRPIQHTFSRLTLPRRKQMVADYRRLYALRLGADYERGTTVNKQTALLGVRLASAIIRGINS
jgi:uncharacterized protein (UPF0332 family)